MGCAKIWRNRAKVWRMSIISDALFSKATNNLFLAPNGMHLRALMACTGLTNVLRHQPPFYYACFMAIP